MRSLTLLEPWHLLLRLVAPEDSTAWPHQELDREVRFVVAPWCSSHKRWRDPTPCARCLSRDLEVGVRVGPRSVRRVLPLDESDVCGAIASVARQLDSWLRRAWGMFSPPSVVTSDRRAVRLLRDVQGAPSLCEVPGSVGQGDGQFETWSFPEQLPVAWEGLVARAQALNRVLARLGRGVSDSFRAYASRRAVEVAQRFGEQGARLHPFIAECLDAVVDCVLVVQMRTVGSELVAKRANTAGSGFLWLGQALMLPQASGAVRLLPPAQALEWIASAVNSPTGRAPSRPNLQTHKEGSSTRVPGWGLEARSFLDETIILSKLDRDALARMREGRSDPQEDAEHSDTVEALRYMAEAVRFTVVKNRQPPPGKAPFTFGVRSLDELRRPQRGMGKRP